MKHLGARILFRW